MSYAHIIPVSGTSLMMHPPRPSKGRSREALRRRDEVRRLRASSQRGTRAALELPPGPLGVPTRSWLTDRSARSSATDRTKAGPGAATAVIGAPEGARVPRGTSHKDFALFGAPSPLTPRARNAPRQGARMPCSSAAKHSVIPAKAGYPEPLAQYRLALDPAFARMTRGGLRTRRPRRCLTLRGRASNRA